MIAKVLWAGPWNQNSAIAAFGSSVIEALEQRGVSVDVYRTERQGHSFPPLAANGEVFAPGSLTAREITRGFDGVVLNLGNYYDFHAGALPLLREVAPLTIFHDAWMGDFFATWRQIEGQATIADTVHQPRNDPAGLRGFAAMSSGAVVHGPHYREAIEAACPGPVRQMPLALRFAPIAPPRFEKGKIFVATIGHINANKRVEEVIRAIGSSSALRQNVAYLLLGPIEERQKAHLLNVARQWRAPDPIFTGWLREFELRRLIETVDVICCLRHPSTEGGSASLITAMLSARPTLVSNQASYAEVPDDLVMKCVPGEEAADVARYLGRILNAPEGARAMGVKASNYALEHYCPKTYADRLIEALEESIVVAPVVQASRFIGHQFAWMGAQAEDPSVERASATLQDLVYRHQNPAS